MLKTTIDIIKKAGDLVREIKGSNTLNIQKKIDGSFVTNADKESEKLIVNDIYKYFGNQQIIISEEEIACGKEVEISNKPFWLIDPIDSTKSYINNKPDYCINITYMENRKPKIGLIYAPDTDTLWYAVKNGGSFKVVNGNNPEQIYVRTIPTSPIAVVSSPGHQLTDSIRKNYNLQEELVVASAIKFCYIAEGKADYYFRKRNYARDWDIASGHIIVEEAGGKIVIDDEENFFYGNAPYLAPTLIARGKIK